MAQAEMEALDALKVHKLDIISYTDLSLHLSFPTSCEPTVSSVISAPEAAALEQRWGAAGPPAALAGQLQSLLSHTNVNHL